MRESLGPPAVVVVLVYNTRRPRGNSRSGKPREKYHFCLRTREFDSRQDKFSYSGSVRSGKRQNMSTVSKLQPSVDEVQEC